uniref:MATH domain-containing protein n=1 Tax=Strigamia maritima TaxID=126957 RepID=T1IWH2_STRMM
MYSIDHLPHFTSACKRFVWRCKQNSNQEYCVISFMYITYGLESYIPTEQQDSQRYCQRCGVKRSVKEKSVKTQKICSFCKVAVDEDKIKIHYDSCDMYPVTCNFCNEKFIRSNMKVHAYECQCNLHCCKFSPIGCQFQGTQLELLVHENDNIHVEMMMNLILNLPFQQSGDGAMLARPFNNILDLKSVALAECLSVEITEQNEESITRQDVESRTKTTNLEVKLNKKIEELMLQNAELKHNYAESKYLLNDKINQLMNQHHNLERKLDAMRVKHNEFVEDLAQSKESLKQMIKGHEIEIHSFKEQILDMELRQGELLAKNTRLKHNCSVKEKLNQLERTFAFQIDVLVKDVDENSLKLIEFEEHYAKIKANDALMTEKINCDNGKQSDGSKCGCIFNFMNTDALLGAIFDSVIRKQNDFASEKVDRITTQHTELLELKSKMASFQYIWKIENFEKIQQEAKSAEETGLHSDPFYSNEFGYKLRLQLHPNGYDDGEGTHLSIFLEVMKGPNDAILNWPIEYHAEISILDQSNNKKLHHSCILESDPVDYKECFNRPTDDINNGCGKSTFLAFDKLKGIYLVDDTVYIKVNMAINC